MKLKINSFKKFIILFPLGNPKIRKLIYSIMPMMICDIIIFILFFPWILQAYAQYFIFHYSFQMGMNLRQTLTNSTFC